MSIHMKLTTATGMAYSITMPVTISGSEKTSPPHTRARIGMITVAVTRMARSLAGWRNVCATCLSVVLSEP